MLHVELNTSRSELLFTEDALQSTEETGNVKFQFNQFLRLGKTRGFARTASDVLNSEKLKMSLNRHGKI